MKLEQLTWPDIKSLNQAETAVVLPVAAVEQHGHHLPLGTDSYITTGISESLNQAASDRILLLPTQKIGSSPHHLVFPGTLTLSSRTFLDVIAETVGSLEQAGFTKFILLNGHGGNQALLNVAVQEIRLQNPHIQALHATYWPLAAKEFAGIRDSESGGMGHAGEMETSVMLKLHPDLVKKDLYVKDGNPCPSEFDHKDMLQPGKVGVFRFWDEWSETGVLGDPTRASVEKGEKFIEAATLALVKLVDDLLAGKFMENRSKE